MTIVSVEYNCTLDNEKFDCFTRINFHKHLSKLDEICRYLSVWKPITADITSVKNENGQEILNIEICRDSLREYIHLFDHKIDLQEKPKENA